jgi:SAM-dependent methyltransferase
MNNKSRQSYFDNNASETLKWRRRNRTYHKLLEKYFSFFIPPKARVLEIGCGNGDLLEAVNPIYGVGIDFSPKTVEIAKSKYPHLFFFVQDAARIELNETFDYIILSDLVGSLWDIQTVLENLHSVCHERTRIIVSCYSYLWEPVMQTAEKLNLKLRQPIQNWLSLRDIMNILSITGFETIRSEKKILLPKFIPLISWFFNAFIANLPFFRLLTLTNFIIARPLNKSILEYSVSIIIPAKNEKSNIENAILRTPSFGKSQEFIFVEGNSIDYTYEEMQRIQEQYPSKNIKVIKQSATGKGNAVREGFEAASGELLFILDADLTTPPESLPLFYKALQSNKGEFINGCRLIYPLEKEAMRFLNLIANKIFGLLISYLLGQRLKDTLCGTKVLYKKDYDIIKVNRNYFGDFDPFGDFDLLFGAAKLNLKIVEVNVRYMERQYGNIQIRRFRHGWLLMKMTFYAARKLKFF